MNIVFLCGSLEPGRDGVGDYVRRLAVELLRQGHKASVISLNDKFIEEEFVGAQTSEGYELQVVRIPSSWPAPRRFKEAKVWIDVFDPEWLSLQFVIFSFHPKGLPIKLSSLLNKIGKGRRWHLMFHELWVGMSLESSRPMAMWGMVQKQIIKSLLSSLQPIVIHTQTQLYQAQLKKLGYKASKLPLFSNVPSSKTVVKVSKENQREQTWVLFGTIHPGAPAHQLASEALVYSKKYEVSITLTLVGRCGKGQEAWVNAWEKKGMLVRVLGEQPFEEISKVLSKASLGLSTNPIALVEKSGTVAAMQAHGLPVLCVAMNYQPRGVSDLKVPAGIWEYQNGGLEKFLNSRKDVWISNGVSDVSNQLIEVLSTAS
ncbi:hypothetical protein [Desertivirga brevis]|uniref:hypothetical protein n=1 Tax=Desertivirga brevis TaxID=2810310 RepID=UPI001A965DAA|nr:hypothetical protein [Pedobacter sp. SYSU D00873]